jgi:hypothetical protein
MSVPTVEARAVERVTAVRNDTWRRGTVTESIRRSFAQCTLLVAGVMVLAQPATADPASLSWHRIDRGGLQIGAAMSLAYSPSEGGVIAFGGYLADGTYNGLTSQWNGEQWVTEAPSDPHPSPRAAAGMAFDVPTGRLVLFGGFDGSNYLGDTWTRGADGWVKATPTHHPGRLTGTMLFQDPLNGHVDLFGGFDGMFYQYATWQWTGTDWKRVKTSQFPQARSSGVCALDEATGQVVLFGGIGDLRTENTWTFDGTDWTPQSPLHQPPQRFETGTAYDPDLAAVVVFGGGSPNGDLGDTWAWTGSDWEQLTPARSPSARESDGLAFDPGTGLMLLGGQDGRRIHEGTWVLR